LDISSGRGLPFLAITELLLDVYSWRIGYF
jgi:hypothetical protein